MKYFLLLLVSLCFLSGCNINLNVDAPIFAERKNTKIESSGVLHVKVTKNFSDTFRSFKTDIIGIDDIIKIPTKPVVRTVDIGGSCAVINYIDGWYYAVTAKHVVIFGKKILVDNNEAEIEYTSPSLDLAIIRFKSDKRYHIYNLGRIRIGDSASLVGFPGDFFNKVRKFAVRGNVCGIEKNEIWFSGGGSKGMSGGPLLNSKNEVVGVVSRFLVTYPHNTSFICCIPIEDIRQKIEIIKIRSKIKRFFKLKT